MFSIGALICPAYYELCNTDSVVDSRKCPNACNFNGDCVDGSCQCFLGFHGHDCSRREFCYSTYFIFRVHFASVILVFSLPLIVVCSHNLFQVPAPEIALTMACVSIMEYVNVNPVTPALTVQLVMFYSKLCVP